MSAGRLRGIVSRTARIARWEVARSAGTVDRKTALILVVMVAAIGTAGFSVADEGLGLEREIYTVGVDEDSRYYDVAVDSEQFRPISIEDVTTDGDGTAGTIAV